jgi:hypothetical protein
VDLNDNGDFKDDRGEDGQPGFPYGRYTKIDGRWYTIVAAPGGDEVSIAPATPQLGQILASQWVATAALSSPQQACFLRFANGRAEAIAGEYHIRSLELEAKDNAGVVWRTSGRCSSGSALTVRTGQVTELPVQGAPLLVTPTVAAADQALMIGWRITGPAGEEFTWPQSNPGTVKPGFEVRDARGITVASAKFEYG